METLIIPFIIILIVLFLLFLLLRELNCWYWKINEIINLLSRIEAKLPAISPTSQTDNYIENKTDKTWSNEREVHGYIERFSNYTTDKLKKMQDKGSGSYNDAALIAVKRILDGRKE